jgi:hypothetical protein
VFVLIFFVVDHASFDDWRVVPVAESAVKSFSCAWNIGGVFCLVGSSGSCAFVIGVVLIAIGNRLPKVDTK